MHRNALQAAMILNIQDVSGTAHLTLKGVYHNCDYTVSVNPVAITHKNIRENYTSRVDKHTHGLLHALEFDHGYCSGTPSATGCPRITSHRRREVAQLPVLSLTTVPRQSNVPLAKDALLHASNAPYQPQRASHAKAHSRPCPCQQPRY
jgi:hypothetical protein